MKISWILSPICALFSYTFLPPNTWAVFFHTVSFLVDTYTNTYAKKKRLAALRKRYYGKTEERSTAEKNEEGTVSVEEGSDRTTPRGIVL